MRFILAITFLLSSQAFAQLGGISLMDKQHITENGQDYSVQNSSKPHSLQVFGLKNPIYKFRVEKGDQWWLELKNQKTLERSELKHNKFYAHGGYLWQSYSFKIDEAVDDAWQVIGQWHGTKGTKGRSPYISLQINGDKLLVLRRHNKDSEVVTNKHPLPLVVGKWQNIVIRSKTGADKGSLRIWIDGKLLVIHDGPLGYADEADRGYWKFGIYRSDSEKPTQVQYTNVRIGQEILREKITSPDPIPSLP